MPLLVATLVAQDTWMAHYFLVLAVNILATIVKLIGSASIFCAGIPGGETGLIKTWPFRVYWWVRLVAILIFVWGWIINFVLATWAI